MKKVSVWFPKMFMCIHYISSCDPVLEFWLKRGFKNHLIVYISRSQFFPWLISDTFYYCYLKYIRFMHSLRNDTSFIVIACLYQESLNRVVRYKGRTLTGFLLLNWYKKYEICQTIGETCYRNLSNFSSVEIM